jgi:PIN domain nuclease of toxin-antitoxin system
MHLALDRVPKKIKAALDNEEVWGLASISLWEIAMLIEKGRLEIPDLFLPWLRKVLLLDRFELLPITPEIAAQSVGLPMHGDPADRLIAATAIEYNCPLATVDGLLLKIPLPKTIPL